MLDIGWQELLVVAVVAIIFVGPKDLIPMLRTIGQQIGKLKRMASEFQGQFNEALREAELDSVKKDVEKAVSFDPLKSIKSDVEKDLKDLQRLDADKKTDKVTGGDKAKSKSTEPDADANAATANGADDDPGAVASPQSDTPEQTETAAPKKPRKRKPKTNPADSQTKSDNEAGAPS